MSSGGNRMSDEEGRARDQLIACYEARAMAAHAKAAQSYAKLLKMAETIKSGQAKRIAQFLASTYNGDAFPWDPFDLRGLDVDIGDDMLACLDALRWAKLDLYKLVPKGEGRVEDVIELWGMEWPEED